MSSKVKPLLSVTYLYRTVNGEVLAPSSIRILLLVRLHYPRVHRHQNRRGDYEHQDGKGEIAHSWLRFLIAEVSESEAPVLKWNTVILVNN